MSQSERQAKALTVLLPLSGMTSSGSSSCLVEPTREEVEKASRVLAGIKFGRKRKLSDFRRAEAVRRRAVGEPLAAEIAKSYAVSESMICRL